MDIVLIVAIVSAIVFVYGFLHYKDTEHPKWLESIFNISLIAFVLFFVQIFGIEITLLGLLIGLMPLWFWAKKQRHLGKISKDGIVFQFASLFPFLLCIFFIRAFFVQPYRVPTGSLAPTVHVGDFILANQMIYGIKMPINHKEILAVGKPERGDIALFYWPIKPDTILVKRVIGLPHDHIGYHNHKLTINGKLVSKNLLRTDNFLSHNIVDVKVDRYTETLPGNINHDIYQNHENNDNSGDGDWVVPDKHYFMLGDNRDNSNDSRFWGMVPESALVGKAMFVWMNFNVPAIYKKKWQDVVLWQRIGQPL